MAFKKWFKAMKGKMVKRKTGNEDNSTAHAPPPNHMRPSVGSSRSVAPYDRQVNTEDTLVAMTTAIDSNVVIPVPRKMGKLTTSKTKISNNDYGVGSQYLLQREGRHRAKTADTTFTKLPTIKGDCPSLVDFEQKFEMTKRVLGRGGQGEVRLAKRKAVENVHTPYISIDSRMSISVDDEDLVAVKVYVKEAMNEEQIKLARKEATLLTKLRHPSIVRALDLYEDERFMFLVMEYLSGGTLFSVLERSSIFTEDDVKTIIYNLTLALFHCQERGILHRDVKPDNILLRKHTALDQSIDIKLDDIKKDIFNVSMPVHGLAYMGKPFYDSNQTPYDIVLGDFGLAIQRDPKSDTQTVSGTVGTMQFTAPEIFSGERYDSKVDIYALGVVMFTLMTGGHMPFNYDCKFSMRAAIIAGKINGPLESLSADGKDLIKWMMKKCPSDRPSFREILTHRFFQNPNSAVQQINLEPLRVLNRNPRMKKDPLEKSEAFAQAINQVHEKMLEETASNTIIDENSIGVRDPNLEASKRYLNLVRLTDIKFNDDSDDEIM